MKRTLSILLIMVMALGIFAIPSLAEPGPFEGKDAITVVGLGGSITAGDGTSWFTRLSDNYFKTAFPGKTVNRLNVGVGGTGSDFGLFRLESQVLSQNPDYVFIEFAINDCMMGKSANDVRMVRENMEGIVRQLLDLPNPPYIAFVYTTSKDMRERIAINGHSSISIHNEIAQAYGIPVIDLSQYMYGADGNSGFIAQKATELGKTQDQIKSMVWSDDVHPNYNGELNGHDVYENYIRGLMSANQEDYFQYATKIQDPISGREFTKPGYVSYENGKFAGTWEFIKYNGDSGDMSQVPWYTAPFVTTAMRTTAKDAQVEYYFKGKNIGFFGLTNKTDATASASVVISKQLYDGSWESVRTDTISQVELYNANPQRFYRMYELGEEGWHKIVITNNQEGKKLTIGNFVIDRQPVPPVVETVYAAQQPAETGQEIPVAGAGVIIPTGTKELKLQFDGFMDTYAVFNTTNITMEKDDQTITYTGAYDFANKTYVMTFTDALEDQGIYTIAFSDKIKSQGADIAYSRFGIGVNTGEIPSPTPTPTPPPATPKPTLAPPVGANMIFWDQYEYADGTTAVAGYEGLTNNAPDKINQVQGERLYLFNDANGGAKSTYVKRIFPKVESGTVVFQMELELISTGGYNLALPAVQGNSSASQPQMINESRLQGGGLTHDNDLFRPGGIYAYRIEIDLDNQKQSVWITNLNDPTNSYECVNVDAASRTYDPPITVEYLDSIVCMLGITGENPNNNEMYIDNMMLYYKPEVVTLPSVSGSITVFDNHHDAEVTFYQGDEVIQTITADAETGAYSAQLDAGTYKMVVSKDNCTSYTVSTLEVAGNVTKDIRIYAGKIIDAKKIGLMAVCSVICAYNKSAELYPLCDINMDGEIDHVDVSLVIAGYDHGDVVE